MEITHNELKIDGYHYAWLYSQTESYIAELETFRILTDGDMLKAMRERCIRKEENSYNSSLHFDEYQYPKYWFERPYK